MIKLKRKTIFILLMILLLIFGNVVFLYKVYQSTHKTLIATQEIKELNRLEVLAVTDLIIEDKKEDNDQWVSLFYGIGIFTVDLDSAEFITNQGNNSLTIILPPVELTTVHLDESKTERWSIKEGGKSILGLIRLGGKTFIEGILASDDQRKDILLRLETKMKTSLEFRDMAEKQAVRTIEALARSINADNRELSISISFRNK